MSPHGGITPELLLKAFRKHWPLAVGVALGVVILTAFYTLSRTRIYRATATLSIDPTPPRPLGKDVQGVVDLGVGTYWSNKEYYATQHRLIKGRAVASETVSRLSLHRDAHFMANAGPSEEVEQPEVPPTVEDATSRLIGRLNVVPVDESRLVVVEYEDADPERATRILGTLLDVYLNRNIDVAVRSTDDASVWLRDQVATLKDELERSELALHDYKKTKRILSVSMDDQTNMLREEMQQLNKAMTEVQARREALTARYQELSKIDPQDPEHVPATELLDNSLLMSLRSEYVRAKGEHASLIASGKGERHPDVSSAAAQVVVARQALVDEIRNVQGAVKSDLGAASREAAGLRGLLEEAKQRALDLNILEIEYRRLERSKDNTEKLYSLVLERSKESDLTGLMRFNNITLAEPPLTNKAPVAPRVPLNLGIGLVVGLTLGFGVAVSRELLDRRIRSPEDLEQAAGVPLLGLLPHAGRRQRHGRRRRPGDDDGGAANELTASADPGGVIAEAARRIRTNLLFASPDNPYNRILITSASPGEGKTMAASTLAIALAQTGRRVLLVDCDLRRARLHRVFGVTNDMGVTTAVVEPDSLDLEKLATQVPNLSLLPAGPLAATPAEVLQSTSFAHLLQVLANRYDSIVVDSPPVAVVTDAMILCTRVDATVFVARAGRTSRDLARRSVRSLTDVGGKVAGCVLNDLDLERQGYGGYYQYGYYEYRSSGDEA